MKDTVFRGCATAVITPFAEDLSVDFKEFEKIIEDQITNGIDAIVVCGTTGEASTMPDEEHIRVIRSCVDIVKKRVPVIAGTGSNHTAHAVKLSLAAKDCGADALLQVTPYYNKTSQRGLVVHFGAVADAVDLPIILYNVPSRTGMTIAPETYLELSKHGNIVGTKEASGNFSLIAEAMHLCGDELHFYSGNDDNAVAMMALGGLGLISVLSNVKPKETVEMCAHALKGEFDEAARMQLDFMPLIKALFSDVNPVPVKEAMNMLGFNAGLCRLPLYELDDKKKELLKSLL